MEKKYLAQLLILAMAFLGVVLAMGKLNQSGLNSGLKLLLGLEKAQVVYERKAQFRPTTGLEASEAEKTLPEERKKSNP